MTEDEKKRFDKQEAFQIKLTALDRAIQAAAASTILEQPADVTFVRWAKTFEDYLTDE